LLALAGGTRLPPVAAASPRVNAFVDFDFDFDFDGDRVLRGSVDLRDDERLPVKPGDRFGR